MPMLDDLPLARSTVDQAAERRNEDGLYDRLRQEPGTRVLLVRRGEVAVDGDALVLLTPGQLPSIGWDAERIHLLGADADGTYLSADLPDDLGDVRDLDGVPVVEDAALVEAVHGLEFAHLRDVGDALSDRDAGLATTAVALSTWHHRHPRCPRCGEPTEVQAAGWVRRCTTDEEQHFPRTDPAVIVALVDDRDRLLLGHAAHWPAGRFSTLAGYVESGEAAEEAVRREIMEEAGVRVVDMEYRGSQPWPFPCSLMLGYTARIEGVEDARPDGEEVTELRLFTRDELAAAVRVGDVYLPMRSSIARSLIEDWYGGELLG
ncbi:NAD(+) diphosphatase [Georgenia sp. Z1491]|uniref:NAD(+) diphosphatase n=1 Tax=Georgenia sp. Z1491 TaxID=3416707 RepID=UPI003CEA4D82